MMTRRQDTRSGRTTHPQVCRVVVLHESDEALNRANSLCDHLLNRDWLEVDLRFDRWSFGALQEEPSAGDALAAAAEADIVVVAMQTEGPFEETFRAWTERWVAQRDGYEGALVGLFLAVPEGSHIGCARDVALHHLALQAGVDYLNHLPQAPEGRIAEEATWCADRASTVTGTLADILHQEPRPHLE